jgi:amino acid adenylation domain-containing protein
MNVTINAGSSAQGSADVAPICVFPTTFAQQRLWFLEQLQPGGTSYLIPWVLRATGELNLDALTHSLNEVIARHEILRTTFSWKDGMPVQVVRGSLTIALPVRDLTGCANPPSEAERLAREEAHTPLDLERGPLVRAQLLRLAPEDHILLLTVHHIIFDGWSRKILVRDLAACYEAYRSARALAVPPPKLQYADFAVWQRKLVQGRIFEKQLSYWRQRLAGAPSSLDLPTDRPRPPVQTFNGAKLPIRLSRALADQLVAFSRAQGATLFMTLLAGFQLLLSRYSNQDDIVVGVPIANRNRAELEEMIGFFANTLALRAKVSNGATFREVLTQVKDNTLSAYDHQDLPFEKLVEEIHPDRNLGQNPLFQVMFSLQNLVRPDFELAGLKLRFMDLGETTAKFDISVFLSETAQGVEGRIEYNTDLFDQLRIQRMIEHYRVLLSAAVSDPDRKAVELPVLTADERAQIVVDWNATQTEYPRNIPMHRLFEQQAERTPKAIALAMGSERITYRALDERANQLAHHLVECGVGAQTLVGIYLERSINMVVALLATLKAGGAYVPLDPAYPRDRIAFIVEDASLRVLITEGSLLGTLPPTQATVIHLDAEEQQISRQKRDTVGCETSSENLAYVLYTSGSTGKPKGVQITHRNLVNFLLSVQKEPGLSPHDTLLAVTTLSFDIAGLELYLPLITGARIVLASRNEAADGRKLLDLIRNRKPNVMQATPATWRMLIDAGWEGTPGLKILCGGEALPGNLASQLLPRCSQLWNMYGPTETTIWSSVYHITSAQATAPIGRPMANTTFYVLDSATQPVPMGVAGELYIGGEGVARGYLGRPELTAQRFVPDPFDNRPNARLYRTGDLVRYLADGNVQYLGRTDFQVKVRGFRIELGEIETVLTEHPAVQLAVVAAREDAPGDKRLVAYIVPKPEQHLNITEARAHLKQSLPDYMLPSAVVELEALPLTPNGKVDRKALPKPEYQAPVSAGSIPPHDEMEEQLLKIWQEVLNIMAVGVTDNFFDLGGHSLLAVRLVDEIRKQTGVEIPLTALFQGATIEHLANIVRGTTTISQAVVHPLQAGGKRPPFFAAVLAGVNALGYIPLSKHLGPEQPSYTLQTPGEGPRVLRRPYSQQEYEEVASEYVRAMRSVQPNGPYHIGGTCEGARIAFEMARTLEAQGQKVALLAIIDTWVLENTQNKRLWKLYYYGVRLKQVWQQSWRNQISWAQKAFTNQLRRWLRAKSATPKSAWIEVYWPSQDFVPLQIHSAITVYKVPKQPFYYHPDPLLGWGNRTTSTVETEVIPRGRHRLLLREPYVRELAAALSRTLELLHQGGVAPETSKPERDEVIVGS